MALLRRDRMETAGLFPLAEFLGSLSDLGIRVTLDDYRRIALALRAGGPWTRTQLRGVLAALLVCDRDQLAPFRRRFDSFFSLAEQGEAPIAPLDVERALSELRQVAAEPRSKRIALVWPRRSGETGKRGLGDDEPETPPDHPWRWTVLGLFLLAGLLLLGQWIAPPRSPVKPPNASPPQTATGSLNPVRLPPIVSDRSFELMRTYPEAPVLRLKSYRPWPKPPAWTDYRLLAVAALGWGVWVWRWVRSLRRITIQDEPRWDSGPRLFRPGTVGGTPAPRLDRQTLDRVADSLGYFRSEQAGKDLDVQESVERTIRNGGIPTPVFAMRRQVRSVLILEDRLADALEWNPIAQELAQGLSERAVPVMHGFFLAVPDRFRSADGFDHRIEDLEDERRGYLVLIFSDAKGLGSPEAAFVLERLARWPQVAWMQLQERRAWDRSARRPALHGLPLFPADPQGLLEALSLFTTERAAREAVLEPAAWRGLPALPVHGSLEAHIEAVLGDSLLWAQSCSMVPPPISLGLADRLRERFHPELPASRIERLLALPGSLRIAGGLQLDDRSLGVLREGFASSHAPNEQEAVLRFLLAQIAAAEPADRDSAAHQAWEWRLERTRLELDPERAAERLLALAQGPLREAIRTDLARRWKPRPAKKRRFLRSRSMRQNTAERLSALVENRELPLWKRYRPHLWPEAALAATALALAAIALWRGSFTSDNSVFISITNNGREPAIATLDPDKKDWPRDKVIQIVSPGSSAVASVFPRPPGQLRLAMLLEGKGMTTARLNASRPGTYELEVGTQSMELPCREEIPEIGLTVSRCPEAVFNWFLQSNKNWLATVGLELTPDGNPTRVGTILLGRGSVQVVYTLRDPGFRPEELTEPKAVSWIRNRWNPWTSRVRMVSWASIENRMHLVKTHPALRREVSLAAWRPSDLVTGEGPVSDEPGNALNILSFLGRELVPVPENRQQAITSQSAEQLAMKPFATQPEPPRAAEPPQRMKTEPWPPWSWLAPPNTSSTEGPSESRSDAPKTDSPSVEAPPCPSPALTRCGDWCVDVKTNPFHYGGCFQIAPSLSRSAAESVDSPPGWSDESISCRRYYRLFYAWNNEDSAVIVRSLPSRSGWNRGPAFDSIALTLSSERIATAGPILAVTDLEIHCARNARIAAGFTGTAREVYEKLSTQPTWRSLPSQPWPDPDETSTNTGLAETLGPVLANWEKFCLDH